MQASCHGVGVSLLLNCRLPVALQSFPDRLPVRRRRFHHHFLDPVLNAPLRQRLQLLWSGRKSEPLKLKLPFARHIGYDYRQHLLVHVDPSYPICHRLLLAGNEERAIVTLRRVTWLPSFPVGAVTPNDSLKTHAPDQTGQRLRHLH